MTMLDRAWTAVAVGLAFWVGLSSVAHAQDIQRVAVLELSGSSVSGEVRLQLSDALREGVITEVRGQGVGVMTRENMAVVMRDMGLDPTCVEAECEVETGRNIGARFVVSGAVTQVESAYVMTIKVHDTVSALVLDSRTTQASQQLALVDQARQLGRAVSAVILREASSQVEEGSVGQGGDWGVSAGNQGVVRFVSTPPGATVFVDGQLQCKATPCDAELAQGEHSVELQLARHHPARASVSVVSGRMQTVSESLKPTFGVVRFTSTPTAAVVLDGQQVCPQTPCERKVDAGQYRVQMEAKDYHAGTKSLTVSEGEPASISLQLRPTFAKLTVRVSRRGAQIRINDRTMHASGQTMHLAPGPVTIELDEACHSAEPVRLDLKEGDERTVVLDVRQRMADLAVEVGERSGGLAPGHFVLDGKRWGQNPNRGEVPLCSKTLSLIQYGDTIWVQNIEGTLNSARPTHLRPQVAQNTFFKKMRRDNKNWRAQKVRSVRTFFRRPQGLYAGFGVPVLPIWMVGPGYHFDMGWSFNNEGLRVGGRGGLAIPILLGDSPEFMFAGIGEAYLQGQFKSNLMTEINVGYAGSRPSGVGVGWALDGQDFSSAHIMLRVRYASFQGTPVIVADAPLSVRLGPKRPKGK